MAGKNTLRLDTSGLEGLLARLARVEHAAAPQVVETILQEAAEQVRQDTTAAMSAGNLPAGGKYSGGETVRAIEQDTSVRWEGSVAWVPIGFDFSKPGAGGYLISGTPRMEPDRELNRIYRRKAYMKTIQEQMWNRLEEHIEGAWEK